MAKLTKLLLTLSMVLVWGWTIFMGTFATHANGRLAGWLIGLLLNVLLGLAYSYQATHPKPLRNGLKGNYLRVCTSHGRFQQQYLA